MKKKKKKSFTTKGFRLGGKGIRHSLTDHVKMGADQKMRDGEDE